MSETSGPDILERTFLHIPGIGPQTERGLWRAGIHNWTSARLSASPPAGFSEGRWRLLQSYATDSQASLQRLDHRYFSSQLSSTHHWRAADAFRSRIAYVDIETDGGYGPHSITVVGVYDGTRVQSFVKGDNLGEAAAVLNQYGLLVTFNGASFDLPLLRRAFPRVDWTHLHVDLRFALKSLGLKGGLKQIEKQLGLERETAIRGLAGDDAIWLWQAYRRGSQEALETLLQYNAADIENLEVLLDYALPRLRAALEREGD